MATIKSAAAESAAAVAAGLSVLDEVQRFIPESDGYFDCSGAEALFSAQAADDLFGVSAADDLFQQAGAEQP